MKRTTDNFFIRTVSRYLVTVAITAAILFAGIQTARAQFDTGTLLGTVTDENGGAIAGANVTITNLSSDITASATTDSDGNFQFVNLRIGIYRIKAEAKGFAGSVIEKTQLNVNSRVRVDFSLKTGDLVETVTIQDSIGVLETSSSDRGQVVTQQQIVNLPLNGRSYADLALLSTGVSQSQINVPGQSGSRDASFNVNGMRSSLNNFIIDGVDNNAYGTSNQGFSNQVVQASPDALEEFKVQTNNFSAEFGRAGGAVINASIRSGTNEFRGSVWNYLRNTALNATGFFRPVNNQKPTLIQNQFGFTYGGPIVKKKIFFFMDYEGYRRVARQVTFASVPTQDQRNGIFTDANGAPIPVRNPYTGVVYANGIIPRDEITPFASRVLANLPLPNATGANNFVSLPRSQFYNDKGDIKLDFNLTDRLTAFVRGSSRKMNNFEAPNIPGTSGGNSNGWVYAINEQLAGGVTYNITPLSILEFRLGISRTQAGKNPVDIGAGNMLSLFGISGLPTDPTIAGGLNTQVINGLGNGVIGRQNSNPQFQDPFVVNPRVNFTTVRGRHALKFGYEYQSVNTAVSDSHPKYGIDTYAGTFSRPTGGNAAVVNYNIADFLYGARSSYQLTDTFEPQYRQRMHFAYVQDDFQVSPSLTFNLGLRYEFATPQYERDNRLSGFDPVTRTVVVARDGSLEDRSLVRPDRNNFGPRIGFAWKATPDVVIRGGYGVSYVHFNRLGGENLLALNPPQVFNVTVDQLISQPLCTDQNFLGCFRPTMMGYPTGLLVPTQFNALRSRVNYAPRDNRTTYVQSFHATVQWELRPGLLLDLAYVGNRTSNLIILGDFNLARPNRPGESLTVQQRRPISNFSFIQSSASEGRAQYDSFQMKIERRFGGGLYFLNSLTLSQAFDNAPGHLETSNGDNSRVLLGNLDYDWGVSGYDVPVINTTSMVYDLPFGRNRRFGKSMSRALDVLFGGYRLTFINRMTSGRPVNLTYTPSALFSVGGDLTYRPNVLGDPVNRNWTPTNYFDRNALAVPTDITQPFGDARRNSVRGPGFWQADVGLHKEFRLRGENTRLELRAEAFNLFNRTNFGAPNGNVSSNAFGTITSAFPAREIQLAVKLYF